MIEYIFAFSAIGLAGLFAGKVQEHLKTAYPKLLHVAAYASLGTIIGSFARYIFHYIAGIIFWGQYAPEGQSPALYSLAVNGTAFLTETLTCLVLLWLMIPAYKAVLLNPDKK